MSHLNFFSTLSKHLPTTRVLNDNTLIIIKITLLFSRASHEKKKIKIKQEIFNRKNIQSYQTQICFFSTVRNFVQYHFTVNVNVPINSKSSPSDFRSDVVFLDYVFSLLNAEKLRSATAVRHVQHRHYFKQLLCTGVWDT